MGADELRELIDRQRPGWSLDQAFYTSDEIYEIERRGWLGEQWYILGHSSELPEAGSYIARELLGEPLLVVRGGEGVLRGFYNVCRHRGSRICRHDGRAARLVCPYHAWAYRWDGTLAAAAALPEGTDTASLGLRPVPVAEIGGLIVGSLAGSLGDLDSVRRTLEPGLRHHGVPGARIAARRSYPTEGNWKLVMENFAECYHCVPSHPEYTSVMRHIDLVGRDASAQGVAWQKTVEAWFRDEADSTSPLNQPPGWIVPRESTGESKVWVAREPIGGGRKTQSQDGLPVASLMGQQRAFDGGVSFFGVQPFVHLFALNDHAVMIQFLPTSAQSTNVIITWLVDGSASNSEIDVDRMIWLWDVTTVQDKSIIEENAVGVRSRSYSPGPYSLLESGPAEIVARYLEAMSSRRRDRVA